MKFSLSVSFSMRLSISLSVYLYLFVLEQSSSSVVPAMSTSKPPTAVRFPECPVGVIGTTALVWPVMINDRRHRVSAD